ncbi:hypothetical protein AUQ37_04160 [Candidatus Methanomethylophilus sp. 1R26]|uniref:hypothetical protein n=1 Tax=Candidatus Methanomethylophilus sp. 1R26 TaxID=1769296 RepID=UPI0007376568|nr:hypothetical protein [Candidatus Methanomethylophilus sp. 1R26]KUE73060.1 hypothetical protein AUQ37_04160 [Candidatus Methanomethylophilus sp. 1R26]
MDSKFTILTVGIIAVVAVAAVAAYVVMSDDDDDNGSKEGSVYISSVPSRLVVFGNADNDDDLDADDLAMIKAFIANGGWDCKANPYADTNADGVLDQKDVDHLEKLLDVKGDETDKINMYYTGSNGNTYSVSYPIT